MTTITYEWTITKLACIPSVGSCTDYVVVADWVCMGTDGVYVGKEANSSTFTVNPAKKDYIPYQDLVEAEVIEWVQDALGFDTVQLVYNRIATQIQGQESPTVVTPPLPWSVSSS